MQLLSGTMKISCKPDEHQNTALAHQAEDCGAEDRVQLRQGDRLLVRQLPQHAHGPEH